MRNHCFHPTKMTIKQPDPNIDYYAILGLKYGATSDDIKKVYKELALKFHPDKNKDDAEAAQKKFMEMQEAFEALSNPETKGIIDSIIEEQLQKAKKLDNMDRKRKTREYEELEKERAVKHRDCLYYCPEEKVFRVSLGPIKVSKSIYTSVSSMREFNEAAESRAGAGPDPAKP